MYEKLIKNKLDSLNKKYINSGEGFLLSQCLNPHHKDSHGSFSINTNTAKGFCFTCGFKASKEFFIKGKMSAEEEKELNRQAKYFMLKEKLTREELGINQFSGLPLKDKEVTSGYRGLNKKTITTFGLYECHTGKYSNRVIFPFAEGEGFTSRTYNKDSKVKYLHSRGFSNKLTLYPKKQLLKAQTDFVIVVEGVIDCLSLWQNNIPSVCNFGVADNFTNYKMGKLLECGIDTLYFMFDNDEAGQVAEEKMLSKQSLQDYFFVKSAKRLHLLNEFYSSGCKDYNEYIVREQNEDSSIN